MEIPDNAQKSVVEMVFIYKVNGVDKEFTEKDLMSLPEGAEFVDRKDKVIVQGYLPPIPLHHAGNPPFHYEDIFSRVSAAYRNRC